MNLTGNAPNFNSGTELTVTVNLPVEGQMSATLPGGR